MNTKKTLQGWHSNKNFLDICKRKVFKRILGGI